MMKNPIEKKDEIDLRQNNVFSGEQYSYSLSKSINYWIESEKAQKWYNNISTEFDMVWIESYIFLLVNSTFYTVF